MGSMMHCKPWVPLSYPSSVPWSFRTPSHLFELSIQNERCQRTPNAADLDANVRRVLKCGCCNYEFCKPEFAMIYLEKTCLWTCLILLERKAYLKLWTASYSVMVLFWATFFFWIIVIHSMTTANMLLRRLRRNFSQLSHLLGCHHWAFCILARAVKWLGFANSSQEQLFGLI